MKTTEITSKISGIYKINFPNNKIYIGRAVDIKRRIAEHYTKMDNTACHKALHKYYSSIDNIDFDILFYQENTNIEELKDKEKEFIKEYKSYQRKKGYNLTQGGDGADYGIYNSASKITQQDLNEIINLLEQGLSNLEIADKFELNPETISRINCGKTYYDQTRDYPIRKEKIVVKGFMNGNTFKKEEYLAAVELIKQGIPITKISKRLGIAVSTLYKINTGKHFICSELNETFPLCKHGRRSVPLNEDEIENIKQDLLNPDLSMVEIAKRYNTSRDTVGDINQGRRHTDPNRSYPIRKFYPKRTSAKKPVSTILESEE